MAFADDALTEAVRIALPEPDRMRISPPFRRKSDFRKSKLAVRGSMWAERP